MTNNVLRSSKQVRLQTGGVSRQTLFRWVQQGLLPQPTKINGRNYWREADVQALQRGQASRQGGDA